MLPPITADQDIVHEIIQPDGTIITISGLPWLQVREPTGLGIPRLTTQDEWVPESGARQHGSNYTLLKLPVREWELQIDLLPVSTRGALEARMIDLIEIFNPALSSPAWFQIPAPFIYRRTGPTGIVYEIDFFYRSGLDGVPDASPDNEYYTFNIALSSPKPALRGAQVFDTVTGMSLALDLAGVKWWYSQEYEYTGTWHGGFLIDHRVCSQPVLGFFLYDVADNAYTSFDHDSSPTTGWNAGAAGTCIVTFDSRDRRVEVNTNGVISEEAKAAAGDAAWNTMVMTPGKTYRLGVKTLNSVVSAPTCFVEYDEMHIGVLL